MRKPRLFSHDVKGILPRMSWSPHNLYNLIARSTIPTNSSQLSFTRTTATIYQQRWRSKRFLRAYHGDWIPERRFKRWFLPTDLPQVVSGSSVRKASTSATDVSQEISSEERLPVASLFLRDVERRIDTIVFRCCFARSAYEARSLVVHGKVKLNGLKVTDPNTLLNPGDLVSVEPAAIPMLSPEMAKRAADAKIEALRPGASDGEAVEGEAAEEAEAAPAGEGSEAASSEAEASSKPAAEAEAEAEGKPKMKRQDKEAKEAEALPAGVLPFNLPPYAAPFLFIPPYLEPSFATCSAIYLRHPTITPTRKSMMGTAAMQPRAFDSSSSNRQLPYHTDLPTPYAAGEELFSLAWEHYAKDAPRVRGDARRQRLEARVGRNGLLSARAKDEWRKRMAVRRGWTKGSGETRMEGFGDGGSLRIETDRRRGSKADKKGDKIMLIARGRRRESRL